jgi:ankyrin repeat protein
MTGSIAEKLSDTQNLSLLLESNDLGLIKKNIKKLRKKYGKNNISLIEILDTAINNQGSSAIFIAAQKGDLSLARLLINLNASIDVADERNNTPLFFAISLKSKKLTKLLATPRNINFKNDAGNSPISAALKYGNKRIFKYLKKLEANFTKQIFPEKQIDQTCYKHLGEDRHEAIHAIAMQIGKKQAHG